MKKAILGILIFGVLIFSGCDTGSGSNGKFSPPNWIIGEWDDGSDKKNYQFTNDNIKLTVSSAPTASIDFKVDYASAMVTVTEDPKTASEYKVNVSTPSGDASYRFVKTSETTLNHWVSEPGEEATGPIVLTKQ